jgi:hypothetical protein
MSGKAGNEGPEILIRLGPSYRVASAQEKETPGRSTRVSRAGLAPFLPTTSPRPQNLETQWWSTQRWKSGDLLPRKELIPIFAEAWRAASSGVHKPKPGADAVLIKM